MILGYSIYELLWLFFIYAFFGWCIEVVFCGLNEGHFINRGFLNGPVCPIYGVGGVIVVLCLTPIKDNLFLLFVGSALLTSILELITGFALDKIFHARWWDYTDMPFNIGGYICLKFSIYWGFVCIALMKGIHPVILGFVRFIPHMLGLVAVVFFAAVLKDQKKTYGKTRMVRMLKENRPLKFFTVPSDRLKEFAREGKKRGLLYVVIRDRKNPSQCEIMVFADDAAKVNRVMDKMNLDFLKSESGEAVQEVAMEADRNQEMPEAPTETVEMPEGEIQFELGDMEQDFGFEEPAPDMENFMQAQEERNPSEPSSRSKDISTGQEKSEQDLLNAPEKTEGKEKPSVRAELDQIKQEKQESAKKKENSKNRRQNRSAGRKKRKKAKTKGR